MIRFVGALWILFSLMGEVVSASSYPTQSQDRTPSGRTDITVETFQVLDLPLNIRDVTLTKTDKGYLLKGTVSNDTDSHIRGLRYLLVVVDSNNTVRPAIVRSESCEVPAYGTAKVTFNEPLKLKVKNADRFELMLDQVIGEMSIWEVLKARQTLESYASGDYSVTPKVLRVSNHVDAPPRQIIYRY
jgi:hypothetical protein